MFKKYCQNHRAISCFICKLNKVHLKCNKFDTSTYEKILSENQQLICIKCKDGIFPFQTLTGDQFIATAAKGINISIISKTFSKKLIILNMILTMMKMHLLYTDSTYTASILNPISGIGEGG